MAGAVELRVLQAEVITLLRETKELLQTRNDCMEEILHSATQGHSAEPAESGQAEPPPETIKFGEDSPGIASQRSSSVSDGLASDSSSTPEKSHLKHPSRLDGMDRIRNYQLFVEGQSSRCEDVNATIAGCTLEPKQPGFVAGSNWSYWRGIGRGSGGDHGVCIYEGRGRPNYMPEWEMIQVDGEWYHMDGASLRANIEFSPDDEFEDEERLVPSPWRPRCYQNQSGATIEILLHYPD